MRILIVLLASLAPLACDPGRAPVVEPPPGNLDVFPSRAFTGFEVDAEEGYSVPAIQHVQPVVTSWEPADPATVVVHDVGDGLVVLEATAVGETTILVSAPGKVSFELPIVVTEYPAGSSQAATELYYTTFECARCHDGEGQPDITSSGLAEHTDAEVLASIVDGVNPEGGDVASPDHIYALDDVQKVNLMAFLRWQASKTYPAHDD